MIQPLSLTIISAAMAIAGLNAPNLSLSEKLAVQSVQTTASFAGKLGDRVETTFIVKVGDHLDTVELGQQHTKFGRIVELHPGDQVKIVRFVDKPNQKLMPEDVKIVRN